MFISTKYGCDTWLNFYAKIIKYNIGVKMLKESFLGPQQTWKLTRATVL